MQKTDEAGIYRLEDGRLRVRATAKCSKTGKMKESQRTLRKGSTMEAAIAMKAQLKTKLREPEPTHSRPELTTLADYCEWWLKRKACRVKRSTAESYARTLGAHVMPVIGYIRLERLTRRDITDWILWAEGREVSPGDQYADATVKSWWRSLRVLLRDAHAQGFIDEDLTARQSPPATGIFGRQEKRTLTLEQLGDLVQAAHQFRPTRYAEICTLAYSGMRVGELYGLEWRDVSTSDGVISIRRAVYRGTVDTPKTGASREVPVPAIVTDALGAHRRWLVEQQHPGLEPGIVFPSRYGERRYPSSLRKALNELCEHLGFEVRVTPQVLRRTFNSAMVEARVDRIVLRSMIGHSSEQMTERYSGIGTDTKRLAVDAVFGDLGSKLGLTAQLGTKK